MNKKNMVRLIALFLVLLLAGAAIFTVLFPALAEAPLDQYQLKIEVLEKLDAVRVDQTLSYTNRTGQALSNVVFNLYANAFRRQVSAPFEDEAMSSAYPDGFAPGGADFFLLEVNGEPADWGVQGDAEAFLRVACALKPGETATFHFGYELLLPRCLGVLGASALGYKLNWFYPMVAPWEPELGEFGIANVSPVGENVFSDPADYRASIDVPDGIMLASIGQISREDKGQRALWTIEAQGARALPILLSQRYQHYVREPEGGPKISAYMADGGGANYALDVAVDAVKYYEDALGAYPLDTLTLAQINVLGTNAIASGMVMLDESLLAWNQRDNLEYEVARGIARQWFGEAVGNNPAREPWLSEATSSYMALMYYKAAYGQNRFLEELNKRVLPALQITYPGGVMVDSETLQFSSVAEYETVVRNRGTASMYEVAVSAGEDVLRSAFKLYIEQNRGRIASLPDFASALNQASSKTLDYLLMEMLQNIGEYANQQLDWYE